MKKVSKFAVLVLVLVQVGLTAVSCGSTATATPMAVPTASSTARPIVSPTAAELSVATPVLTLIPTEELTDQPSPELVGSPTSAHQVPRITVEELKVLMDSGAKIVILDNRPRESYQMGHIKGAISFPWKVRLSYADLELLSWTEDIVTYCECGPGEADSADVALQLIEAGFTGEIRVLAHPAIEGWIELGYPSE